MGVDAANDIVVGDHQIAVIWGFAIWSAAGRSHRLGRSMILSSIAVGTTRQTQSRALLFA